MKLTARNLATAVATAAVVAGPSTGDATAAQVATERLEFTVTNVNRSALACASDGGTYTLDAVLVGPKGVLESRTIPAATLYLHDFGFGKWFWQFPGHDGAYDYAAAQARAGEVSVLIDRLGYDESDHPLGMNVCVGSQADMAHQVVGMLLSGRYGGAPHPPMQRVVLAGHSVGVGIAELSMYSFPEPRVAGLAVFAWADQGFSQATQANAAEQGVVCTRGGEPAEPGEPGFYAFTPQTEEGFHAVAFHSADADIREEATRMWNRDPCGDAASLVPATSLNQSGIGDLEVPVLLMFGRNDPVWNAGAPDDQAALFSASPDVRLEYFPGTGHALTLEQSAPQVRRTVREWLDRHKLSSTPEASPPRRRCVRKRRFTVFLGRNLKRATATLNGRRLRIRRGRVWRAVVDLRGRSRRSFTLRVRATTRDGRTIKLTRRYRICRRPA
jgi:pimeloyl-ACP methyl ester carboxylesterase